MVKMNRFIQFNDETVDAQTLLMYERLGTSIGRCPFLRIDREEINRISTTRRHYFDECFLASSDMMKLTHAGRLIRYLFIDCRILEAF